MQPRGCQLFLQSCFHECWGHAPVLSYLVPGSNPGTKFLSTVEENLAAVVLRAHGEVHPVGGASLLLDQFVQFPAVLVSRVKQDTGVADHLFWPSTSDIYGAARQMIAAFRPTTEPIHLLAPIPTRDDHGDLHYPIAVSAIVPLPEQFQPQAQPCQILYRHMAWDVLCYKDSTFL